MTDSSFEPSPPTSGCELDVQLMLQRFEGQDSVQSVNIMTESDGTIKVASHGKFQYRLLRQFGRIRDGLMEVSRVTGGDVIIEHEGYRFAHLRNRDPVAAKLSIYWWSILRHAIGRSR